jgi:5-methylcytosine-specific restriction endonuclease McrA
MFTVPEYRKTSALFCSRKCMALDARQQTISNCAECGSEFSHISSRANKAKYCGPKCYHKAMSKKGKTQYQCQHCSVGFLGALSQNRKYCSKACVGKAAKEIFDPVFTTVRKTMLKKGLILQCNRCGYDAEIKILGVHHKDRNRKNNALNNLEVLCPNCHSLEHAKHVCHGFSE